MLTFSGSTTLQALLAMGDPDALRDEMARRGCYPGQLLSEWPHLVSMLLLPDTAESLRRVRLVLDALAPDDATEIDHRPAALKTLRNPGALRSIAADHGCDAERTIEAIAAHAAIAHAG